MLHAHSVIPAGQWSGEPVDSVVLDYDERYRRRFAMTGVRGLGFLLDLPEAVMLRAGDGLKLEDGGVVEVVAAPEPLAEIRAADAAALTRVAWHLGNRHLPTELTKRSLRIRRDAVIEDMARGLGATVVAIDAPFNPEGGAYVRAAGGGHDHDHAHAHGDDHDHHHDHGHDHHDHDHHDHSHGHAHGDDHKH
jgi:urease accessory protein